MRRVEAVLVVMVLLATPASAQDEIFSSGFEAGTTLHVWDRTVPGTPVVMAWSGYGPPHSGWDPCNQSTLGYHTFSVRLAVWLGDELWEGEELVGAGFDLTVTERALACCGYPREPVEIPSGWVFTSEDAELSILELRMDMDPVAAGSEVFLDECGPVVFDADVESPGSVTWMWTIQK